MVLEKIKVAQGFRGLKAIKILSCRVSRAEKKGKRDILAFKLSLLPVMVEGKTLEADIFVHVHITVIQNTGVVIPAIYKKKQKKQAVYSIGSHKKTLLPCRDNGYEYVKEGRSEETDWL